MLPPTLGPSSDALGLYGEQTGIRAGTVGACLLLPLAPVMVLGNANSAAGAALLLLAVVAVATVRFVRTEALAGFAAERTVLAGAAILGAVLAPVVALVGVVVADEPAQRWPGIGVLAVVAALLAVQGALAAPAARRAGRRVVAARAWATGVGVVGATAAAAAAVTLGLPSALGAAVLGIALTVTVYRWPAATRPVRRCRRSCSAPSSRPRPSP